MPIAKYNRFVMLSILIIALSMLSTVFVIPLVNAQGATIWTDKENYDFWETVTIFGSGFLPNAQVTITIQAPDLSVGTILRGRMGLAFLRLTIH